MRCGAQLPVDLWLVGDRPVPTVGVMGSVARLDGNAGAGRWMYPPWSGEIPSHNYISFIDQHSFNIL